VETKDDSFEGAIAMEKLYEHAETGCCPRFDPGPWDDKEVVLAMEKLFFFYTTCPKCAKAYGKNYVVLLAKV